MQLFLSDGRGWACRVIKEGGIACLIGPVHPTFWLSRLFADAWMLFPTEDEYTEVSCFHLRTVIWPTSACRALLSVAAAFLEASCPSAGTLHRRKLSTLTTAVCMFHR